MSTNKRITGIMPTDAVIISRADALGPAGPSAGFLMQTKDMNPIKMTIIINPGIKPDMKSFPMFCPVMIPYMINERLGGIIIVSGAAAAIVAAENAPS